MIHFGLRGPVAGSFEHGNEAFGSTKGKEFLDQLNKYQIFEKDSAP
jgi:hypothetical protein